MVIFFDSSIFSSDPVVPEVLDPDPRKFENFYFSSTSHPRCPYRGFRIR